MGGRPGPETLCPYAYAIHVLGFQGPLCPPPSTAVVSEPISHRGRAQTQQIELIAAFAWNWPSRILYFYKFRIIIRTKI